MGCWINYHVRVLPGQCVSDSQCDGLFQCFDCHCVSSYGANALASLQEGMGIDRQQFGNLAKEMLDVNESESDSLFTEIDVDGSGSVSYTEISDWIESPGGIDSLQQYINSDTDQSSAANPMILMSDHSLLMVILIILCIIALTLCIMIYKMYTQNTPAMTKKAQHEAMEMESDIEEPLKRRMEEKR